MDSVEDHLELCVIPFPHIFEFVGDIFVCTQKFMQSDEGSHDRDVRLNRPLASKDS